LFFIPRNRVDWLNELRHLGATEMSMLSQNVVIGSADPGARRGNAQAFGD
jgi:hypothetical protein